VQTMRQRRQLKRYVVNKSAKIVFGDAALVDCTVCNVNSGGACLSLKATTRLPEVFELSFDSFRSVRACRVVWRKTDRLGVCFH
jgi:hypothetical protein